MNAKQYQGLWVHEFGCIGLFCSCMAVRTFAASALWLATPFTRTFCWWFVWLVTRPGMVWAAQPSMTPTWSWCTTWSSRAFQFSSWGAWTWTSMLQVLLLCPSFTYLEWTRFTLTIACWLPGFSGELCMLSWISVRLCSSWAVCLVMVTTSRTTCHWAPGPIGAVLWWPTLPCCCIRRYGWTGRSLGLYGFV